MRQPQRTTEGDLIVEVALTEDVWRAVQRKLRQYDGPSAQTAVAAIEASVLLARHHDTR